MKTVLIRGLLLFILLLLFIATNGQNINVTRMVAGQAVQLTFNVGDSVLVLVGCGVFIRAIIVSVNKRGRVSVKFEGGEKGTVTKTALYHLPGDISDPPEKKGKRRQ